MSKNACTHDATPPKAKPESVIVLPGNGGGLAVAREKTFERDGLSNLPRRVVIDRHGTLKDDK